MKQVKEKSNREELLSKQEKCNERIKRQKTISDFGVCSMSKKTHTATIAYVIRS